MIESSSSWSQACSRLTTNVVVKVLVEQPYQSKIDSTTPQLPFGQVRSLHKRWSLAMWERDLKNVSIKNGQS